MEKHNNHIVEVVLYIAIVLIVFVAGMSLHIKIIKRSVQAKLVTWQTEIFHSVVMIIHFALVRLSKVLVYMIPDYTVGLGICMLCRFIREFGLFIISVHSLSISVQKYFVIIHRINDNTERNKLEKVTLVICVTFSILWSVASILRFSSSIPMNASLGQCFQVSHRYAAYRMQNYRHHFDKIESNQSNEVFQFCQFEQWDKNWDNDENIVIYFMTQLYCVAQSSLTVIIALNIFEAFVYYKVFKFNKR